MTNTQWKSARLCALLTGALLQLTGWCASAADWKPVKRAEIVVTSGPGGGNDRVARMVQKLIQEGRLVDHPISVVNKPGGGGVVGFNYLNQHAGDGHYMAIASATLLTDHISGRSQLSLADVVPIAQLCSEYLVFAVKADSTIRTGKDLMALLNADAGSISTAISASIGNHNHIALGLVTLAAGGDVKKLKLAVFNAGGDAMTAALGGHVDLLVTTGATAMPQYQSGRLRLIAITAPKRLEAPLAGVPTWRELGANVVVTNSRTVVGPRGLAPPQVAYWENVLAKVTEADDWKKMLELDLLSNEFMRSEETRNHLKLEYDKLKSALTALGLAKSQ
jgi:putative tricarboxylic transport membrane protein